MQPTRRPRTFPFRDRRGVVYSDEVVQLCTEQRVLSNEVERGDTDQNGVLYDPLLNPPQPSSDPTQPWTTAVLILIPLRLGLDSLNTAYMEALQKVFEFPQCVGIIGGKRAHSVYFVGAQGSTMHLLDPHTVHPTAKVSSGFPSATHLRTMHCSTPLVIEMANIDPSLAIGFMCRDQEDYADFCERVNTVRTPVRSTPHNVYSTFFHRLANNVHFLFPSPTRDPITGLISI